MNYYEYFKTFLPNYKKQYFVVKLQNNMAAILEIKSNILKNWHLTPQQKQEVLKKIGIKE